jgi:hypothetical protein
MVLLELMDKSLLFGLPEEVGTTGTGLPEEVGTTGTGLPEEVGTTGTGLPEEVGTTGLTCMINSVVGQHYFDADPDPDFHADV